MNLDEIFGSLEDNDSRDGLNAETLAEIAGEVAVAQAATLDFLRRHPELLPCRENSVAFVRELLWIQKPPSVEDLEALYEKLRGKLVLRESKTNKHESVFGNVAGDLEELGAIGSD